MSKMQFVECGEDAYIIMRNLVNEYHSDLRNCKIKLLFYDKPRKRAGKLILATTEAVNPKYKYLTNIDFIISIYDKVWEETADIEKKAILDHELSHCFIGEDKHGNPVYTTIPHDVEDFKAILDRYGTDWADNIYIDDDNIEMEESDN